MAPMIDIVFLLIIFFVLISTFASTENVRMELPKPVNSKAVNAKLTDRVIVNCLLTDPDSPETSGVAYSVGPSRVDSLEKLSTRLAASKAALPHVQVVIRADKRLPFGAVREVMLIVARNNIEVMNLVAHVGEGAQTNAAGR